VGNTSGGGGYDLSATFFSGSDMGSYLFGVKNEVPTPGNGFNNVNNYISDNNSDNFSPRNSNGNSGGGGFGTMDLEYNGRAS